MSHHSHRDRLGWRRRIMNNTEAICYSNSYVVCYTSGTEVEYELP